MMKRKIGIIVFFALAIIFAGVFFLSGTAYAESEVRPWEVDVTVRFADRSWRYKLSDNLPQSALERENCGVFLGAAAKKQYAKELIESGLPEKAVYCYLLPNFKKILSEALSYAERDAKDAVAVFGKNGNFDYVEGVDGRAVDVGLLFEKVLSGHGKHVEVLLPTFRLPAVKINDLKKFTVVKASFSTSYGKSGENRSFNVAKAAAAIDGTTLKNGCQFSFNGVVGPRTEKTGYKNSKVIVGGMYVEGVGGGVCQVSTTLYNTLLLSELNVDEVHQHTLVSSYVEPGFDAMVSYNSADLKFTNNTGHDLYIQAAVKNKKLTFTVYGAPNKYRVVRESVEKERDRFAVNEICDVKKFPELVYKDQSKVLVSGSDGVKSNSFLNFYDGEELVSRKLIRQNSYKKVNKVVARGDKSRPETESSEPNVPSYFDGTIFEPCF